MNISLLMNSSQITVRTHNAIKLEALKNATLNSINGNDLDESFMEIYIYLIETFTPMHILVMRYYDEHDIKFGVEIRLHLIVLNSKSLHHSIK